MTDKDSIRLNLINPETGNRIRQKVVDAETGDELVRGELVRGYEFSKDRYVTLTDDELNELKVESSETMDVEAFVPASEIPAIYFESAYYVVPDGKVGEEAYAVIRDAMVKSGKFALSRVVFSRKERLIALQAEGDGMAAFTLRDPVEVRASDDYFKGLGEMHATPEMLAIARQIVDSKSTHFEPTALEDRYEAKLRGLIEAKLKGVDLDEEPAPSRFNERNVVDLMDALKRSLAGQTGKASKSGGTSAVRSMKSAAPANSNRPGKPKTNASSKKAAARRAG